MNNKIKKAEKKSIQPAWTKAHSYLNLNFDYEDVNESIESLIERCAGNNPRVLIDQINAARVHILCRCSPTSTKHLLSVIDYFLKNGIDVNAKGEEGAGHGFKTGDSRGGDIAFPSYFDDKFQYDFRNFTYGSCHRSRCGKSYRNGSYGHRRNALRHHTNALCYSCNLYVFVGGEEGGW